MQQSILPWLWGDDVRHTEVIYLLSTTITFDDIGNQIPTPVEREIYADELYVGDNAFYSAAAAGMKPEKQFEIYSFEYAGESKLKHNDVTYNIIHSKKKGDKTRVICEKVIGSV